MRVMRNKNDWMQKKSIIIILVVLLLVAILAVAAELGMKSGGRPNKIIEKIIILLLFCLNQQIKIYH